MATSYVANPRNSLTISLPVGSWSGVTLNDVVEMEPNGSVQSAKVADYACAVINQSIVGSTPLGSGVFLPATQTSPAPMLVLASGNIIVAAPISAGSGLGLSLLSPLGVQSATAQVVSGVIVGSVQLLLLSNGNIAVTFNDLTNHNARFAIYTSALAVVQAVTTDVAIASPALGTWTARTLSASGTWSSVCWGNGTFVALNTTAGTLNATTSPDGITWTNRTLPTNNSWSGVAFGNGIFVAVAGSSASANAATSPDGITWTARTLPTSTTWSSVCFGNGQFVAVAGGGSSTTIAATSPDGITWTARTLPTSTTWIAVAYGGGLFVAVSNTTTGASSPDGITWTTRTLNSNCNSLAWGNGVFVALTSIGGSINANTSPDGITWTNRSFPSNSGWCAIVYANGLFMALAGGTTNAATSPDGITWTARTLPSSAAWVAVSYGNNLFVAVAGSSTSAASCSISNIVTATCALNGGGFAELRQITSNFLALAIYSNTASVVLASTTIVSSAASYQPQIAALSSGGFAAVWFTGSGFSYAVYSATGTVVQAVTALSTTTVGITPQISALSGYFAITYVAASGLPTVAVYSNAGVLQGTAVTVTGSSSNIVLINDGATFWAAWVNGTTFTLVSIPITGGANAVTRTYTVTSLSSPVLVMTIDAITSRLLVLAAGSGVALYWWSVDLTNPAVLAAGGGTFGASAGAIYPAIAALNDAAFLAYADYELGQAMNVNIVKHTAVPIVGVAGATVAAGGTVPVLTGPAVGIIAAYPVNALLGSANLVFNHQALTPFGNRGQLNGTNLLLRGII